MERTTRKSKGGEDGAGEANEQCIPLEARVSRGRHSGPDPGPGRRTASRPKWKRRRGFLPRVVPGPGEPISERRQEASEQSPHSHYVIRHTIHGRI